MVKETHNIPDEQKKLIAISAFISATFILLVNLNSAAVTWPAIDNLPGVYRQLDPTGLANDFFTNASAGKTPRLPYIYVLSLLTKAVDNGIGGGLAVVKAVLLILLPIVVSLLFFASIKTHMEDKNKKNITSLTSILVAVGAPLFIFLLQGRIGALLSVAWWVPLYFDATPHNVSLLLTIFGFLMLRLGGKCLGVGVILVFLGAIIHPAVSLFSSVFSCILLYNFDSLRKSGGFLGVGICASLVGSIFVKILFFEAGDVLSAQDFVRIYAFEAHPSHYIPSQFGSLSKIPWMGSFSIISGGLLIATIILYKLNSSAWKNSFFAFIAYSFSIALQFLFVELTQIKLMATLGPSRFTMFGTWFLFIFYSIIFMKLLERNSYLQKISERICIWITSTPWFYICFCYLVLALITIFYSFKSGSFDLPDDANMLATFAREKSSTTDVFVLPFFAPRAVFPLKTGRAIFFGNGFPFNEMNFLEWEDRNSFVNGSSSVIAKIPGSWIGAKYATHYRSLTPSDFLEESKKHKIDWVVVEADYAQDFSECRADFESSQYRAYSIPTLTLCTP